MGPDDTTTPESGEPTGALAQSAAPTDDAGPALAKQELAEPTPAAKRSTSRGAPKWETDAKDRIRGGIRKFAKPLQDLLDRDANEGDTRLLVTDFLCYALGFDKFEDLTTEYQVKGEFADYGVRIEKQLVAFIEVKRVATKLNERHLRQVQMYAANEGVEWMVLTNGAVWRVYHLSATVPLEVDLALEVDLTGDEPTAQKVASLFYLSRDSLKRHQIDELWQQKKATSPPAIAAALLRDSMIDALRKEIRRTSGYNADPKELHRVLRSEVIAESLRS